MKKFSKKKTKEGKLDSKKINNAKAEKENNRHYLEKKFPQYIHDECLVEMF